LLASVTTLNIACKAAIFEMPKRLFKAFAIIAALAVGAIGISTMVAPVAEAGIQFN
jgi:hypothetical protein